VLLELHGPLKRYGATVTIAADRALSPAEVRAALVAQIGVAAAGLLEKSAFSDDERVLSERDLLEPSARYAVLPPVAGG
jgi:molybdopterin synthase sulfur carrier subunit